LVSAFQNTPYAPDIDVDALAQATEYFTALRQKYMANGTISPSFLKVDTSILHHQMPSGVHSFLFEQMCRFNGPEVLKKVLEEIPFVRADAGYPPLVTPIAEIIYTQALQNVLDGTRYKTVTTEFFNLIAGRYGTLPINPSVDFRQKILGDVIPITHRPADTLAPSVESYRAKVAPYAMQEEDLLSLAMLEEIAVKYFEWRKNRHGKLDSRATGNSSTHPV
jgi:oxaloacetate decarboxylase alpha subunit